MPAIDQIAQSLRHEFAANLAEQKATVRSQVGAVRRDVKELRAEHGSYHTETTLALAGVGDRLTKIETGLEQLLAARARRARVVQRLRWLVTSTPGLTATAGSIAGAVAALIALL